MNFFPMCSTKKNTNLYSYELKINFVLLNLLCTLVMPVDVGDK